MDPSLPDKLGQLRASIQELPGIAEEPRRQLLQTLDDLEQAASTGEAAPEGPLQPWEDALLALEARHPDATQWIKNLAETLARTGL